MDNATIHVPLDVCLEKGRNTERQIEVINARITSERTERITDMSKIERILEGNGATGLVSQVRLVEAEVHNMGKSLESMVKNMEKVSETSVWYLRWILGVVAVAGGALITAAVKVILSHA